MDDDRRPRRLSLQVETDQRQQRPRLAGGRRQFDRQFVEAFGFELERQLEPLAAHAPGLEPCGEPFHRVAGDEQERFQVVDRPLQGLRLAEGGRRRKGSEWFRVEALGGGMERRSALAETAVDLGCRQAGKVADRTQAPELQRVEDFLVVAVLRRGWGRGRCPRTGT